MKRRSLVDRFKEYIEPVSVPEPECANRVQKESYVCKKMGISRNKLYEICLCTGIDVMYEELRKKSGAK